MPAGVIIRRVEPTTFPAERGCGPSVRHLFTVYRQATLAAPFLGITLLAGILRLMSYLTSSNRHDLALVSILALVVGGCVGMVVGYVGLARVRTTTDGMSYSFGPLRRSWNRADLVGVQWSSLFNYGNQPFGLWMLLGTDGRCHLCLCTWLWRPADLQMVTEAAGLQSAPDDPRATLGHFASDLRRDYVGLPVWAAHPLVVQLGFALIISILAIALLYVFTGPH
jgi:hypothetical protein